ncbi:MAG: hypothetical protein ABW019_03715 [Chitinophagaceae bacterium]
MRSICKILLSLSAILAGMIAKAQVTAAPGIGVTLSITPPYSPRLSDYAEQPGKLVLLLKNNSDRPAQIYLKVTITGDNGVVITTKPNYKPPQPIVLQSQQLLQADINVLRDLLGDNQLAYTHVTPDDIVKKNGIPEGNYQVCIQAFNYATNLPVSDPATSCRQIRIASLEPPVPVKPFDNESIKSLQPQTLVFNWTTPAGAEPGTKYRFRIVEILDPKKNPNDAYRNSRALYETELTVNTLLYGPGQPPLVKGRKYAWAVTALPGPRGTAYRNRGLSTVKSFVFGEALPAADMVKLVYPADKAMITPDPNPAKNFATWDYDAAIAGGIETPFIVVMNANQSPEDALQKNQNIAGGKEPYKQSFVDFSKYAGKTLAWKVTVNTGGKSYTSKVQTFTILAEDKTAKSFNSFILCGFPVSVNHLNNTSGFVFSGTGTTQLYKNGPSLEIAFNNLIILPFDAEVTISKNPDELGKKGTAGSTKVYKRWVATSGTAKPVKRPSGQFNFKITGDADGTAWFGLNDISYTASILSKWDDTRGYFVQTGTGSNTAYYTGKFSWKTGFLARTKQGTDEMIGFTSIKEETFEFDFDKKFNKKGRNSELQFSGPGGTNTISPSFTKNITIKLVPTLNFDGENNVSFLFDGSYEIAHPKKPLKVTFEKKPALAFDVLLPKGWQQTLNTDGSVMAYFDNVHVDLSWKSSSENLYGLSIPSVSLLLSNKGKQFTFAYKNAYFSDDFGLSFGSEKNESQQISLMGFPVITKKSVVAVTNSTLVNFKVDGDLVVPVINQKAGVNFLADEKGMQKAEMVFVAGQTTTLYNNAKTGDKCTYKANYGTITDGKITVGGAFSFSNSNPEKNLNVANVEAADLSIYADGHIGMPSLGGLDNTLSHPEGNLNGYQFTANVLTLTNSNIGYRITIGGVLVMADNLSVSSNTGNNFHTSVEFSAAEITNDMAYASAGHGPSANDPGKEQPDNGEISFSTTATAGSDNESSAFNGAKLKYYDTDDVYGTGFRAEVSFALKSPADPQNSSAPSIKAVLMIGHMSEGYNYWFLEAGQKNIVVIPTGVLDLAINGFTGRVFYHMRHDGDNINDNNTYVPDDSKFMGIYGQVNLKTATDDGVKFWGDLSLEMATTNSGPEYIKLLGNGDFISSGEGSPGLLQAKDCKLEITASPSARIYGNFNASLNAYDIVTVNANAGFDISKSVFHIWGSGSASFMGKEAPVAAGFDLDDNRVKIMGKFKVVDLNWHNDGIFCDDDVLVEASISLGAEVIYSPFQFNGAATFSGYGRLQECGETILKIPFSVDGQVQFPSPTCISMGISIGPFDLALGFRDGSIIFDNCF